MKNSIFILCLFLVSCLESETDKSLPDIASFTKETDLMIRVCSKLASESDAKVLHKAAVATQKSRMINCRDFNGECDQYLGFLSAAIRLSEDNELTEVETSDLEARVDQLKKVILEGKARIRKSELK